jgi:hypothetical protein
VWEPLLSRLERAAQQGRRRPRANYGMLRTFEPFRQGDRHFPLISPRAATPCPSTADLQPCDGVIDAL